MDEYLSSMYYDPKRSGQFGGAERLYEDVRKEGRFALSRKEIREWLMKQEAYTLHKPSLYQSFNTGSASYLIFPLSRLHFSCFHPPSFLLLPAPKCLKPE
jgi:hypothetical protein